MKQRIGEKRRRALLVDSESDIRRTISRYLQLHGMDVVEVDTLLEADGQLIGNGAFDLLVTELVTSSQAHWHEWRRMVTRETVVSLLIHGPHIDEWNEVSAAIGRSAGFLGKPFTFSDFHWALHQLL
jgi:DNA-binding NtrC family response regulator